MIAPAGRYRAIALIIASLIGAPALAVEKTSSVPLLPGSNSKDPISIDADKLEYFDKEQKAIYTGNVVAIQGDSKLTCSVMILFLAKNPPQPTAGAPASDAAGAGPSSGGTQVKHMDATGPVTVVSKTQVATGDRGSYDKDQNKVWLFDLRSDPTEHKNLAASQPDEVKRMMVVLNGIDKQQAKPLWPSLLEGPIYIDKPLSEKADLKPDDEYIYWAN